ncbi:formiminoglutamase [Novosphingobium sp. SG751A]|uniref:N-formylglutamate deformylase n=1 Tax=Novosphingobium sp. SG751A TaxID=2587000 RepID=UPI0015528081|nr:formiminoglutamase [Novosphingobium sp. SG751A]
MTAWLDIIRGDAPLVVAFPHTGTDIPGELEDGFVSPWLARKDADWWVNELYGFAAAMGATMVRTRLARTVIDCNRDPSGASLYPGQATTGLCPTESFDGEPLYRSETPRPAEIERRLKTYFEPYHQAISAELARLRARHDHVVLYDAHSIRSRIPRLFEGELPYFNVGTFAGRSCDPRLTEAVQSACSDSGLSYVINGRFQGGWTTRHYGQPEIGIHAIQMEVAQRGYMREPPAPTADSWPTPLDPAAPIAPSLREILEHCISFAKGRS